MNFDFKNMQNYQYFVIIGSGVAVLAVLLYFVKGARLKIPAAAAVALCCLVVGFGAGVLVLGNYGYTFKASEAKAPQDGADTDQNPGPTGDPVAKGDMPKMPKGKGGMPGMPKGMGGMPGMMGKGPNSKAQLVALVTKLNLLTEKPLSISLDADRKKKIAEEIKDLDTLETLSESDAKKRLGALLDAMKDDRSTLESAGYNWPGPGGGGGGGGRGKDMPNPFKSETNEKAVKALQERLATK
jgi:hypothetical protein